MRGFGEDYMDAGGSEGRMASKVTGPSTRQNSKQPGGKSKASGFGKGKGKGKTIDGVTFDGEAGGTAVNGGNYNEVGSSARRFG